MAVSGETCTFVLNYMLRELDHLSLFVYKWVTLGAQALDVASPVRVGMHLCNGMKLIQSTLSR